MADQPKTGPQPQAPKPAEPAAPVRPNPSKPETKGSPLPTFTREARPTITKGR
ncbi:MAG: hypothetical protein M0Z49_07620 [Chloroflexi bacterium]|nr:hypothetical protein [Chloroflexota bacterium]